MRNPHCLHVIWKQDTPSLQVKHVKIEKVCREHYQRKQITWKNDTNYYTCSAVKPDGSVTQRH